MTRSFLLRLIPVLGLLGAVPGMNASGPGTSAGDRWIGTWATAPQPPVPGTLQTFRNQSVRLVVHVSVGGTRLRIRLSNIYGWRPLLIGRARVARRSAGADIDPGSNRALTFQGRPTVSIPGHSTVVSDPLDLDVPALSDLAISLFFPEISAATTSHSLARQTNYVSAEGGGDVTGEAIFPVDRTLRSWPILTGVDVVASAKGGAIVALGSSLTDGDGASMDSNRRWPDVLAERLQKAGGAKAELGVLNLGIIGNRLLHDSPPGIDNPFGAALGESGVARFERDVLEQAGVRYVFVGLGINDIAFPGKFAFTPPSEDVTAEDLIKGYRQLVARAHRNGVRVIGTTMPPFENSFFKTPHIEFYTPEKDALRRKVNTWILTSHEFDAVVDFDAAVRDPARPTQILAAYDAGDHLHVNDAGYTATANVIPLSLFDGP